MRRTIGLLTLVCLLIASTPAQSQDKAACDLAPAFRSAQSLKPTGDTDKDVAALMALQDAITAAHIVCKGLTFSGQGSQVLRPFDLPAGMYKMVLAKGDVNVSLVKVSGDNCTATVTGTLLETTVLTKGCRATLKSLAIDRQEWTVTLEPLQ